MEHLPFYAQNREYAAFLSQQDAGFFRKYVATLEPANAGGLVLDVGSGVGQVVAQLAAKGFAAQGIDVCAPAVEQARQANLPCSLFDGKTIPFADASFDAVGAFNVLEHVDAPVDLMREMVRVARPGGRLVISSPNFFRVIGFCDYHPHMRGLRNKARNAFRLLAKRRLMRESPENVAFDRLTPIARSPLQPDDDAVTATNALEIAFHLRRLGCRVDSVSCTDRVVNPLIDFALNCSPLRYGMFNAFVVAMCQANS